MTKIFDQCKKSRFYRLFLRPVETLGKIDGDGFSLDGAEALSLSFAVDCRIGSLEKIRGFYRGSFCVDCRIGSLEIDDVGLGDAGFVDCRIGSLEKVEPRTTREHAVDCRIGSLEIRAKPMRGGFRVDCRIGSLEKTAMAHQI